MKYYVGITDSEWFQYLKSLNPDEVNFWRPMSRTRFSAIPIGSPFLFKLHKPLHYIVGGGFFAGFISAPLSVAWEAFGQKNGAESFDRMRLSIEHYRAKRNLTTIDPFIGCITLTSPFFFDEKDWIEAPLDWGDSIVQGKSYDTKTEVGRQLWDEVNQLFQRELVSETRKSVLEQHSTFEHVIGSQYLATSRLGQGAFRLLTLDNYDGKCCITGETTIPTLEAAHIHSVSRGGNHRLENGLLMRSDMHRLFDRGLISVDARYRIRISPHIREQYCNGDRYYAREGEELKSMPQNDKFRPDPLLLQWHMEQVFQSGR